MDDGARQHLFEVRGTQSVPALCKFSGLSYQLVYNVVHGRVKSLSDRHYRLLFGEVPRHVHPQKVDGRRFRSLVRMWLFLNENSSKAELFREFYGDGHPKRPDYRIFSGQVRRVDARIERRMQQKFLDAGVSAALIEEWLDEMEEIPVRNRVAYNTIRPILFYLWEKLDLHPNAILQHSLDRYESGRLRRVSRGSYLRALALQSRTEAALSAGDGRSIERIKESVSGGKPGYTLYIEIEDELKFLKKYARRGAKHYLGRSGWTYKTGNAKRIENRRVANIRADCERFVRHHPDLPVAALPPSLQRKWLGSLVDMLVFRATQLLSRKEGLRLEKSVLKPDHAIDEYKSRFHGFTQFDRAPGVLGMRRKAFDLMVATNCEIFRTVGTYAKKWYLSDLYLKELTQKQFFELISVKYELLAKQLNSHGGMNQCLK
jgi:hypothetical protein